MKAVREGVDVDEASNFSRWLRFSGIIGLLKPYEQDVPLPIRASELERKNDALASECGEWFSMHDHSNHPRDAYISRSKLAAIDAQLQTMAEQLNSIVHPELQTAETGVRSSA